MLSNNIISQGSNIVNNNSIQEDEKNSINNSDVKFSIDDSFNDWLDDAVPLGIDFDDKGYAKMCIAFYFFANFLRL